MYIIDWLRKKKKQQQRNAFGPNRAGSTGYSFVHCAAAMGGNTLWRSDPGRLPWPDAKIGRDTDAGCASGRRGFDAELYPFSSIKVRGLTFSVGRISLGVGWALAAWVPWWVLGDPGRWSSAAESRSERLELDEALEEVESGEPGMMGMSG